MKLFRTADGCTAWHDDGWYSLADCTWNELTTRDDLESYLLSAVSGLSPSHLPPQGPILAPVAQQEVWAAGVTYFRSRTARMEESERAGGGTFYDRVYSADRPELFFKATPHRVVGPDAPVHIRADSKWNVPEPELALLVTPAQKLIGYTIGNDMSSRDIEGENPLYLPQAKVYNRSCALGPGILVSSQPLTPETHIYMEILRSGKSCFSDEITLSQMKRDPLGLVDYLFRENSFPHGCFLLTGTGIIPGEDFTLQPGDLIRIGIDGIGTLENLVD